MGNCPSGATKHAGLCYKPCPASHPHRSGLLCYSACPPILKPFGRSAGICNRYKLGVPTIMKEACPKGSSRRKGGLCYEDCKPGYHGIGNFCYQNCPVGTTAGGTTHSTGLDTCTRPDVHRSSYNHESECLQDPLGAQNGCHKIKEYENKWYPYCGQVHKGGPWSGTNHACRLGCHSLGLKDSTHTSCGRHSYWRDTHDFTCPAGYRSNTLTRCMSNKKCNPKYYHPIKDLMGACGVGKCPSPLKKDGFGGCSGGIKGGGVGKVPPVSGMGKFFTIVIVIVVLVLLFAAARVVIAYRKSGKSSS